MARAEPVVSPLEEEVRHAGDAMMLLISRSTWDLLQKQGHAEKVEPGTILSKAITEYIEAHGSEEAKTYLTRLGEASRAAR